MPSSSHSRDAAGGVFPLNAEQRAAVEHGEGPLLVVAGAGTGKTRVITERIRNLLEQNPGLAGENILGLTFTNKAAGEMKHRVVKAVGERAEGVWLSTFHSFCLERILREANAEVQPLEDIDHRILLRRNIAELGLVVFRRLAEPAEFLQDFQRFFSRCQDELVTPEDYRRYVDGLRRKYEKDKKAMEADARAVAEEELAKQEELARVYEVSERLLRERNLATFGAQLLQAVELLQSNEALLQKMREQYRYILVDEFQDTNVAQLELLWLLAGDRRNIFAVGDDDQAIYRFRGASFGSFTIFLEKFCGVKSAQPAGAAAKNFLVSLSQNYRSTQRILRVAGEAIQHNEKSPLLPPKKLTTQNSDGERIRVVEFAADVEEAEWVAAEIDRLHEAGAPWRSFAVLYRKRTHRTQILNALRRRGIPFVIRKSSILASTIVRDLLAWLRLIATPADNISCARVLAAPYWGLEARDLVRLAERAQKNHGSLWDEIEAAQKDGSPAREGVRLGELVELMGALRRSAKGETASELMDQLIAGLGITPIPAETDRQHVDRLVEFVKEWQRKSEQKRLRDFIEYLNYFDELEGDVQIEEELSEDAVQLMTVHAAKGLEFPHVFVLRLSRNDFPSGARRPKFEFPPELMKEEQPKADFQQQEERRLFYVALTRAQKRLTLSTIVAARKKPSPFLEDILANAKIQKVDIAQSAPKVDVPPSEETAGPATGTADPARLFPAMAENTRAYSHIALWAKSFHPARPEPLQLSATAVETYESCPMKYQFQYLWNIRGGPSAQLQFGQIMHTTIREFVAEARKRKRVPLEELLAIYDREWSSAGFPDEYQEEEYRKAGREQLEAFHRRFTADPPDVLFQEKAFELPLEHGIVMTGRIDQVNRLDGRRVEIVDYKTGKVRDAKKAESDMQLSVYALAAREVLDLAPERLVLHYLVSDEDVATTRDAKALKKAEETIAAVADRIRAGDFPAKPGFLCGYCDFKPLCPAHEQLLAIQPRQEE
ncbi:MAG TPA: UvrD-helicase domain-containing protein [Verrucomicrobiae bacterium]|nr:UvrD-helicase domain-containing protein [Verrucomicrobiae bacterium]